MDSTEQEQTRKAAKDATETACKKWLIDLMHQNPTTDKNKDSYQEEAQTKFLDLSDRAFLRAWKAAIKETDSDWNKPGRKS